MTSSFKAVEPAGVLDSTHAEAFRKAVDEALSEEYEIILIDLEKVSFIDSSGLGSLVMVLKKVRAAERKMYICSINDQVRMLFDLTGMDRVFEVFADRAEFEAKVLS
ncbi:STAS domain-containing protein [Pseudanabaena sp. FACHB-2040]|uniref:STAS domain-containing protein n=1 Tax=Pseudanabaena sp. FACHB-2040 TaxID=2692859 RepID=UPI001681E769|nr:STAS domain-containing protein [Pseudanabaena sp. FACHB-2040]MBD2257287.1 STAS domain-containing protein [Pseudanabaena sp. FACHB-2040]